LTVAAGEYSVAAEFVVTRLACNGHDEERTWHGLLAQKLGTGVTVAIQTKTASFGMNFQVNARCETPTTADNEWYVLVKLHEEGTRPSFYILPRNVVAGADLPRHTAVGSLGGRGVIAACDRCGRWTLLVTRIAGICSTARRTTLHSSSTRGFQRSRYATCPWRYQLLERSATDSFEAAGKLTG
jgi:hypothetical protein